MFNVVLASDDGYAHILSVCLVSILKNNCKDFEKINIFILDDGIKSKNRKLLNDLASEYCANLEFIKLDKNDIFKNIHGLDRNGKITHTTYARLFIPSLLPNNIDKVLYLDVDSLILDSFKELWKLDLEDNLCAAVIDVSSDKLITKTSIGLTENDYYYNAGVLLIDLKGWRKEKIEEKFLNFLENRIFYFHDQDIINGVLKNRIKTIHPKYNFMSNFHELSYEKITQWEGLINYYTKEEIEEARKNPVFIHFSGTSVTRPWHNPDFIYRNIYEEYASLTKNEKEIFKDDKKIDPFEKIRYNFYKTKLVGLVFMFIPKKIFVKNANRIREQMYEDFFSKN